MDPRLVEPRPAQQVLDPFAANAFFPHPGSLAYCEHAFGIAALVQPWFWLSDNPVILYTLFLPLSYLGSAATMYLLVFCHTRNRATAFVACVIFGFCFFRTHHFGHLTLFSSLWLPVSILLFLRLCEQFRMDPCFCLDGSDSPAMPQQLVPRVNAADCPGLPAGSSWQGAVHGSRSSG